MLLSGEPGVGKTTLLNGLADSASAAGTTVMRVTGAEFEGEISFIGLNQLLFPLLGDLDGLGQDHRDALRVALGFNAACLVHDISLPAPTAARGKAATMRRLCDWHQCHRRCAEQVPRQAGKHGKITQKFVSALSTSNPPGHQRATATGRRADHAQPHGRPERTLRPPAFPCLSAWRATEAVNGDVRCG